MSEQTAEDTPVSPPAAARIEPAAQPGEDTRAEGLAEMVPDTADRRATAAAIGAGGPSAAQPGPQGIAGQSIEAAQAAAAAPPPAADPDPDPYAVGGGWYRFPDGNQVQGRDQAVAYLTAHPQA